MVFSFKINTCFENFVAPLLLPADSPSAEPGGKHLDVWRSSSASCVLPALSRFVVTCPGVSSTGILSSDVRTRIKVSVTALEPSLGRLVCLLLLALTQN